MFTLGHLLFSLIGAAVIAAGVILYQKKKPPIRLVLKICFVLAVLSEVVKTLSVIRIVPVVEAAVENGVLIYRETGAFTPYLEAEHLPFELCSYQIFFIGLAMVVKNQKWLKRLYALMYTSCVVGAGVFFLTPSAAIGLTTVEEFFTSVMVWRAFLYHAMVVVLGICIGTSEECGLRFRDIGWSLLLLICLDYASFYLNSIMSTPIYQGDTLLGVGNAVNYFSSYNNPLGIVMSDKGQWLTYLAIRLVLAVILTTLAQLPLLKKERRERHENN